MRKRKKSSSKVKSNTLKYTALFLFAVVLILGSFVGGYYLGHEDAEAEITAKQKQEQQKRLSLLKKIEQTAKNNQESVNNRLKEVLKKETESQAKIETSHEIKKADDTQKKEVLKVREYAGASHEYSDESLADAPVSTKTEIKQINAQRPRLAIIIDDVSVRSHVNAIKSLGLPITMSFLPPSKSRPNSAKLASKEEFYMVHLPMEAQNFTAEEPLTLRVNDSQQVISSRIGELKKLFPKAKYINNHTGSKYTANEIAMNRLIFALNANNISFVDSRTTAQTKAPKVLKNFGLKYVARDVFLDHHMDKPYIISQIKKAVKIAEKDGVAIAIGHPHANTILALHESKKLFKDVDLVLINKVY